MAKVEREEPGTQSEVCPTCGQKTEPDNKGGGVSLLFCGDWVGISDEAAKALNIQEAVKCATRQQRDESRRVTWCSCRLTGLNACSVKRKIAARKLQKTIA